MSKWYKIEEQCLNKEDQSNFLPVINLAEKYINFVDSNYKSIDRIKMTEFCKVIYKDGHPLCWINFCIKFKSKDDLMMFKLLT